MRSKIFSFILFLFVYNQIFSQSAVWEDSAALYLRIVRNAIPLADSSQLANSDLAELYALRSNDDSLLTMAWYYKGIVYHYAGFHEASNEYYFKALQQPEAVTNTNIQYGILNNIGINYDLLGKPDISLEFYHKALKIGEAEGNDRAVGQVKINLGRLYRVTNDYEKSDLYLQDALEYFESVKDTFYIGLVYQNIASLLADTRQNEKNILKAFNLALENYQAIGYQYGIVEIYHNLAVYYQKVSGDKRKIVHYYQKALGVSQKANTHSNSATLILALARIAIENGNYRQAEKYALESLEMSKLQNIPREQNNALKLLTQIYLALNEEDKGTRAFLKQIELSDSLFNKEKTKSFNELSILHDLKYKNQLILNQQLEIDNRQLREAWLRSLLAAAVLLIVMLGIFLRFRSRKLREQYELNLQLMSNDAKEPFVQPDVQALDNSNDPLDNIGLIYQRIQSLFISKKPYTDSDLSIATLAELLNTNQNYISRAINEYSGMNFYHFLNKYRTSEARRLIEENGNYGLSLEQIMYKSGYRSRSVFISAFKKITGMTPGQFQKYSKENKKDFDNPLSI